MRIARKFPVTKSVVHATARVLIFLLAFHSVIPQTLGLQRDNQARHSLQTGERQATRLVKPSAPEKPGPAMSLVPNSVQPSVLFVVGSTTLTASDTAVKSRLEGLGYTVTVKSGSGSSTTDANSKNLITISSTVTPSDVNTKYCDVTVPVIVYENALFDDMKMT